MVKVVVVIREVGRPKPDYSLDFELPEIPAVGTFLSIQRPDKREPFGEDLIVRSVWWRLKHPETRAAVSDGTAKTGQLWEIFVECDPALTPYSSDSWRAALEGAKQRGIRIEEIDAERFAVRESDLT